MWAYDFMQHALLVGVIIATVSALISVFVVLRHMVFATHALGHMSITGFALASILSVPGILGQTILNLTAAIIMGTMGDKIKKNDLVTGVVLSFVLGLGVYFLFLYQNNYSGSVMSVLFGNILAVSMAQIYLSGIMAICILIGLIFIARPLYFLSIDPVVALAKNVPLKLINIVFFILVALSVSISCQIVGALLLFVLLVIPGAIALELSDNIYLTALISVIVANIALVLSLVIAYRFDIPVSFCITSILCTIYLTVKTKTYLKANML